MAEYHKRLFKAFEESVEFGCNVAFKEGKALFYDIDYSRETIEVLCFPPTRSDMWELTEVQDAITDAREKRDKQKADDLLREQALAKLTPEERRVLGR